MNGWLNMLGVVSFINAWDLTDISEAIRYQRKLEALHLTPDWMAMQICPSAAWITLPVRIHFNFAFKRTRNLTDISEDILYQQKAGYSHSWGAMQACPHRWTTHIDFAPNTQAMLPTFPTILEPLSPYVNENYTFFISENRELSIKVPFIRTLISFWKMQFCNLWCVSRSQIFVNATSIQYCVVTDSVKLESW